MPNFAERPDSSSTESSLDKTGLREGELHRHVAQLEVRLHLRVLICKHGKGVTLLALKAFSFLSWKIATHTVRYTSAIVGLPSTRLGFGKENFIVTLLSSKYDFISGYFSANMVRVLPFAP